MTIALILGGAPSVWEDLERAQALTAGRETIIVATNHAGRLYRGHIDGWATLHPEAFAAWRADRAARGLNTDYRAFMPRARGGVDAEVRLLCRSGSSGMYAAEVAVMAMGAAGAILCGVPIDAAAGHIHDPGDWEKAPLYRPAFVAAKAEGFPVRSMSGWTRDLLGEPDAGWLDSLGVNPAKPRTRAPEATMRIKMLRTRNYTPAEDRRTTTKFLEGQEYTVKRDWGAAMVADGDAKAVRAPKRATEDQEADGPRG